MKAVVFCLDCVIAQRLKTIQSGRQSRPCHGGAYRGRRVETRASVQGSFVTSLSALFFKYFLSSCSIFSYLFQSLRPSLFHRPPPLVFLLRFCSGSAYRSTDQDCRRGQEERRRRGRARGNNQRDFEIRPDRDTVKINADPRSRIGMRRRQVPTAFQVVQESSNERVSYKATHPNSTQIDRCIKRLHESI